MSMQLKRYFSKHKSTYSTCFPTTVIIDTWNASDDIKVDFGLGVSTTFECANFSNVPFRTRLEWALDDANEEFCRPERADWTWILKPSVTNKGANSKYMY